MRQHVKVYMDYFGYSKGDFIPSELSGDPATQIHHIKCRGMGGSKNRDNIENLIALTFAEHEFYGDKKQHFDFLIQKHKEFLELNGKNPNFKH